jgi:1-acyl-sn-glycerol-3-phosphate acyltransferase
MPDQPPVETLSAFERTVVRLARRMNQGRSQRFWFWFQRQVGARWIAALTGPITAVEGLEHVRATSRRRPLLLVANHRTLFDFYVVMSVLFRRVPGWRAINFPVRGRYFYQRVGGVVLNCLAAFWSMYPPFFHNSRSRRFDQWALTQLAELCRERPGQLVGFHPEGTRNRNPDPYSFLPAQPGIGRLLVEARPEVVPVFIAGLGNNAREILRRRFSAGEPIRIRFGPPLDYQAFLERRPSAGLYRELAEFIMEEIRRLGEEDRKLRATTHDRWVGSGAPERHP